MRESYEGYYLIVFLVLFVLVAKLSQTAEVKFPRFLGRKGFFPVREERIFARFKKWHVGSIV